MRLTVPAIALLAPLLTVGLSGCFPIVAGGVGAGAMMIDDRRTSGIYIEDERIELRGFAEVNKLENRTQTKINFTSFNRIVLLTGQVPDEATRERVGKLAADIENVRKVHNELKVAPPATLGERSNDTYITSRVKTRFLGRDKGFSANHVKVVTEMGMVYLMGLVKPAEAEEATALAAATPGVKGVVKLFEMID